MRYETQWAGDAIAAPICSSYDREDAFFESRDDRPCGRQCFANASSAV
jgi:hypothetical protein